MFFSPLWATGSAAPPELGFTGPRCSTHMSPLRGWERSLWGLGQSLATVTFLRLRPVALIGT